MRFLFSFAILVSGMAQASAWAGDLSRYRTFELGSSLPAVSKQSGISLAQVKVLSTRPALIQELAWRPQPSQSPSRTDSAQEVIFSFYNGELFHIVVNYDRYETEGLTGQDIISAISSSFGMAAQSITAVQPEQSPYSDQEQSLAVWADSQYSFELLRAPFGPTYKLVGSMKRLESAAQIAIVESARLDTKEAPQREADRTEHEDEADRVKLEKARLANKPKFRP
ncbi:MAG: hypothetical protein ABI972_23940 [Acidobacteriota bacterium]